MKNDYFEETKKNELLSKRLNKNIKIIDETSEKILKLISENENYKNKQIILDSFKEETYGYIEILKKDNENKSKEIENLIIDNGNLKCKESKNIFEKDIFEREKKELIRNYKNLELEKNILKEEIFNLNLFVNVTFDSISKSGIYEKFINLINENISLKRFKTFYCNISNIMKGVNILFEEFCKKFTQEFLLIKKLIKIQNEQIDLRINEFIRIENKNRIILEELIRIKETNGKLKNLVENKINEFVKEKVKDLIANKIEGTNGNYKQSKKGIRNSKIIL